MRFYTVFIAVFGLMSLGGCSQQAAPLDMNRSFTQELAVPGAFLEIPSEAVVRPTADVSRRIADTDHNDNDLDKPAEYRIAMQTVSSPCTPSLTGASKTVALSNAGQDASWGRVDFWDIDNVFYHRGIADLPSVSPLCHPPIPSNDDDRLSPSCGGKVPRDEAEQEQACGQYRRDYELEHGLYSAYALCSERDGKTVVICLSQMTDDPKMAEEIFSTFRWTE